MLEDFSNDQPIAYKIMKNAFNKEKESHAYLVESNGYSKALDMAVAFAKLLLCNENEICGKRTQMIDDPNILEELKIIEPEGLTIKKEQLKEIKEEFSKKALYATKKIYIINKAECLNQSSSNSILKFLEEPENNIIAILITDNKYRLLDTIVSRCQLIRMTNRTFSNIENSKENNTLLKIAISIKNNEQEIADFLVEDNLEKIEKIITFVNYYENNGLDTLLYMNKLWNETFNDKEKMYLGISIMSLYYKDILNAKINLPIEIFDEYQDKINTIANNCTVDKIVRTLNIIGKTKEKINSNFNSNLIMDKLIMELEEVS